jgi:hypothetical protein
MAAEAVRYVDNKPALNDGLRADVMQLLCGQCQAEYRVHYSGAEVRRLDDHRLLASERINAEHPRHSRTILI